MPQPITELLERIAGGDRSAANELAPLVYQQLRQIAKRQLGRNDARRLDATELVHEAYLRLLGDEPIAWRDRAHFFATASTVIRRVLVDEARKRQAQKRGGDADPVSLDLIGLNRGTESVDLVELDEVLEKLEQISPRGARLVELRFFGGLTQHEAAEMLGVSLRTVAGDWAMARAWLARQLS